MASVGPTAHCLWAGGGWRGRFPTASMMITNLWGLTITKPSPKPELQVAGLHESQFHEHIESYKHLSKAKTEVLKWSSTITEDLDAAGTTQAHTENL